MTSPPFEINFDRDEWDPDAELGELLALRDRAEQEAFDFMRWQGERAAWGDELHRLVLLAREPLDLETEGDDPVRQAHLDRMAMLGFKERVVASGRRRQRSSQWRQAAQAATPRRSVVLRNHWGAR